MVSSRTSQVSEVMLRISGLSGCDVISRHNETNTAPVVDFSRQFQPTMGHLLLGFCFTEGKKDRSANVHSECRFSVPHSGLVPLLYIRLGIRPLQFPTVVMRCRKSSEESERVNKIAPESNLIGVMHYSVVKMKQRTVDNASGLGPG